MVFPDNVEIGVGESTIDLLGNSRVGIYGSNLLVGSQRQHGLDFGAIRGNLALDLSPHF